MSEQNQTPLTALQRQQIEEVVNAHKDEKGALIPVLHKTQEILGYLPKEAQQIIADGLDMSLADVYAVVTFYTQFSLNPKGKYEIGVCLGTACYVKGSGDILNKIKELLGINEEETTEDGLFSLTATRCVGACGLAPVVTVNKDVYGRLTADDIEGIIAKYR